MTGATTLGLLRSDRDPDGHQVVDWVDLPPDSTVRIGGHEFFIPRGGRRLVLTDDGYEIVSHGVDPRPLRERVAALLHRWADRVGGVR